ncbi:hypothetical protein V513_12665 [Mesotoga sp. H07.pep.5.3]|nr:hypothetical protein V513_12665 [Mesotoga sp. H07.pep.5.3]
MQLLQPSGYAAVSVGRNALSGFYPYWFLNPSAEYHARIGSYTNLMIFILPVGTIFVAIDYAISIHFSPRNKFM